MGASCSLSDKRSAKGSARFENYPVGAGKNNNNKTKQNQCYLEIEFCNKPCTIPPPCVHSMSGTAPKRTRKRILGNKATFCSLRRTKTPPACLQPGCKIAESPYYLSQQLAASLWFSLLPSKGHLSRDPSWGSSVAQNQVLVFPGFQRPSRPCPGKQEDEDGRRVSAANASVPLPWEVGAGDRGCSTRWGDGGISVRTPRLCTSDVLDPCVPGRGEIRQMSRLWKILTPCSSPCFSSFYAPRKAGLQQHLPPGFAPSPPGYLGALFPPSTRSPLLSSLPHRDARGVTSSAKLLPSSLVSHCSLGWGDTGVPALRTSRLSPQLWAHLCSFNSELAVEIIF